MFHVWTVVWRFGILVLFRTSMNPPQLQACIGWTEVGGHPYPQILSNASRPFDGRRVCSWADDVEWVMWGALAHTCLWCSGAAWGTVPRLSRYCCVLAVLPVEAGTCLSWVAAGV